MLIWELACGSNGSLPSVNFVNVSTTRIDPEPQGVVTADFNQDGKVDLAIATSSSLDIFLGNGDGTFTSAPTLTFLPDQDLVGLVVADFNRDGKPDIAISTSNTFQLLVFLGNGDGTFTPLPAANQISGLTLVTGDFNGDGIPDLVAFTTVLLGNGDGTFTPAKASLPIAGSAAAVGDFNGDGKLDLAVVGGSSLSILLGNGDGTFTEAPTGAQTGGDSIFIAVGDLNHDGKLDLAVANLSAGSPSLGTVTVLLGNGDGTFRPTTVSPTTGSLPWSIVVADFNGDGNADLATTNVGTNDMTVLLGNGDGTFGAPLNIGAGKNPIFAAVGDFRGNGIPDVAVIDQDAWLKIFLTQPQIPPTQ